MKKTILSVFFFFLLVCSCSNDVPSTKEAALIQSPLVWSFLCDKETVRLEVFPEKEGELFNSVQWYETDSKGEPIAEIEGGTDLFYEVPAFESNEIHYYICKVSKGNRTEASKVFSVAHTGLPVVTIETDGSRITKDTWLAADLNIEGNPLAGEIKGRGNSTWIIPKKSFSLKLSNKKALFEMPEHKRWVLIGNSLDESLLRNIFASYLGNEVFNRAGWNPSFVFVDLVINGEYRGNYILGEQIKISSNRVDITDISKKDAGVDNGGFIVEVNRYKDELFNFVTDRGVPISLKDPDEVSEDIQQYVQHVIQTAEDALFSESFKDEETGYSNYFDVDSVIDWYLVNEITSNYDAAFMSSVYMYYDNEDEKIHMGPNWDFDLSCGKVINRAVDLLHIQKSIWMKRFFEDPAFEAKVKARYSEIREDLDKAVNIMLPEKADQIAVSALLNNERWEISKDYKESVNNLIIWVNSRLEWLDEQWL